MLEELEWRDVGVTDDVGFEYVDVLVVDGGNDLFFECIACEFECCVDFFRLVPGADYFLCFEGIGRCAARCWFRRCVTGCRGICPCRCVEACVGWIWEDKADVSEGCA